MYDALNGSQPNSRPFGILRQVEALKQRMSLLEAELKKRDAAGRGNAPGDRGESTKGQRGGGPQ